MLVTKQIYIYIFSKNYMSRDFREIPFLSCFFFCGVLRTDFHWDCEKQARNENLKKYIKLRECPKVR